MQKVNTKQRTWQQMMAPRERWRHRLLVCLLAPPFLGMFGLGLYLDSAGGTMMWTACLSFLGVVIFGVAGIICEKRLLRTFRCPRCGRCIPNHHLDAKLYVSYACVDCGIHWDTGVSLYRGEVSI